MSKYVNASKFLTTFAFRCNESPNLPTSPLFTYRTASISLHFDSQRKPLNLHTKKSILYRENEKSIPHK